MGEINYAPLIDDMVWSYSRIKAFVDCPYRFYLKYIRHIHGKEMFFASYGTFMGARGPLMDKVHSYPGHIKEYRVTCCGQ